MVAAAEELAAIFVLRARRTFAREEFRSSLPFGGAAGCRRPRVPHGLILTKPLPLVIKVTTSAAMVRLEIAWRSCWNQAM